MTGEAGGDPGQCPPGEEEEEKKREEPPVREGRSPGIWVASATGWR